MKILLWILIAIAALLILVSLVNVKITVGNSENFYYKINVSGIRIRPEMFMKKKDKHRKEKPQKEKKSPKSKSAKKKKQTADTDKTVKKKKKSAGQIIRLVGAIAKTAAETLPKGFRIKLKFLRITVGAPEAELTAVTYGKLYALLSGLFALFDGYKGFLYGFYAKRNKVILKTDYLAQKTKAEFELTISFFLWQLIFAGMRIGVTAITEIIRNAAEEKEKSDTEDTADSTAQDIS